MSLNVSFKSAIINSSNLVFARTENGMKTLHTTLSNTVDLFFQIGASRGKDITEQFARAYAEDREIALRIAQWARDIRGGAGERELFRQILKWLEKHHKEEFSNTRILQNVAEIGRWDDLLIFEDQTVNNIAFGLIREALQAAANAKYLLDKIDTMSEEECQRLLDSYNDRNGVSS